MSNSNKSNTEKETIMNSFEIEIKQPNKYRLEIEFNEEAKKWDDFDKSEAYEFIKEALGEYSFKSKITDLSKYIDNHRNIRVATYYYDMIDTIKTDLENKLEDSQISGLSIKMSQV